MPLYNSRTCTYIYVTESIKDRSLITGEGGGGAGGNEKSDAKILLPPPPLRITHLYLTPMQITKGTFVI